ncbi:helix-turn-helix domain-containing protein [Umezawaea sp. Da 62-37]|uniref:helix-turn-helix domain-containing protein n=1 Tax=Umezawaea sp. Da 62-37 TaxID=3075927 RepID=UPI0028F71AF6|nr:helix-turn-helix domain-containing protein [Umezawaea sp. Da 62-37]WNV88732.1 helix-turn-helix domain-containing protein [Umezawaea sp. Da 62-37]
MPGGRLTHDERGEIAAWLTEGLNYAEIARRLERPTSTVSREVSRNGGRERYRADRAQRATGVRARRSTPTPPPPEADGRDAEAVRALTERFTATMVRTGFPRMMARVLVCLLTSDTEGRTAADLARLLQVGPGTVSKAVRPLEHIGLLRRDRDAGGRRERYVLNQHLGIHAWSASARSMAEWAHDAKQAVDVLGPGTPAGARMLDMSLFLDLAHHDMTATVERWQRLLTTRPEGGQGRR